ncbi:ICOS ligand-like [Megalobrama amblycephala]|uniref:ICOS ligand-like n=1 Tax=Megalobrama amblycephala TaxID=75352 RepID=UPI00201480B3|nr:ICOS ligand-like [Megalobrama amblycephala]XP_048023990.1 ICOS ligand-like [Megalobrama amblycephala]XP_048023998.1 ICOS ligand-like [Megalobrama amblycephala]XP_048024008.1 ICOS ligand-like [Megalobrama amblycephala]
MIKVSLQVTVEAVIGGSVVLPCSSTEHDHKLQDIDVHWRDNNDKIVYSIIEGKDSLAEQNPKYKNRAETFPDEYLRGNFSIKLNNLTYTDARKYICYITQSSEQKTVQLLINNSTAEKVIKSTEHENHGKDKGANSVETSWHGIVSHCISCIIVYSGYNVFLHYLL